MSSNISSTDNINLGALVSTRDVGIIAKASATFIHNFGDVTNSFLGLSAGNLFMSGNFNTGIGSDVLNGNDTGTDNVGVGSEALVSNDSGSSNTAIGSVTLANNTSGDRNVAVGSESLLSNTTGGSNTAVGTVALVNNITGILNVAVGDSALFHNIAGSRNISVGAGSLVSSNGDDNIAVGYHTIRSNTTGISNIGIGSNALFNNISGSGNIAIGDSAGINIPNGDNNIYISNQGPIASESDTIRIGDVQTSCFIAGINGVSVGAGILVLIDSDGQLGTLLSSERYKRDIKDIDSNILMQLKPREFRYKTDDAIQYGFIAEEISDPNLVVYNSDGEPETIKHHLLLPLAISEIQRLNKLILSLETRLQVLESK